jgi:uncharacterized protein (TIGR02001 family)
MTPLRSLAPALAAVAFTTSVAQAQMPSIAYSFNGAITTDYIFRGFSQTERGPTAQIGGDLTFGIGYVGFWASGLDFGRDVISNKPTARAEIDLYAGIKPTWNGFNFDFGGIYYLYPRALDNRLTTLLVGEADYFELKAGVSREWVKAFTTTHTLFWSPDYTNSTGSVFTLENGAALNLPAFAGITPSISALLGYQTGDAAAYKALVGNGKDNYLYWNAGVTFTWEKFSLDVRYWDTNISNTGAFCTGTTFQCDERVMATAKFTY